MHYSVSSGKALKDAKTERAKRTVTQTADLQLLWKAVEEPQADDSAKLALVDALIEAGELELASTVHWCVQQKRWPKKTEYPKWQKSKSTWNWATGINRIDTAKTVGNSIPRPIHEFLELRHSDLKKAIEALCTAMVAIQKMLPQWKS